LDNESGQATALVSAAVPSTVAARVELHETTTGDATSDTAMTSDTTADAMSDGTDMGSGTDSEMMGMRPVSQIELPEGQSVELVPGGYHVMLLELVEPLQTGQTVQLTLTFADGTTQTVDATVREQ
jgi:copper(I)-binding protein